MRFKLGKNTIKKGAPLDPFQSSANTRAVSFQFLFFVHNKSPNSMSVKEPVDEFSKQTRIVVIGALSLSTGIAYSSCATYLFVLNDKTNSIAVPLQFALLVLYALLFTLLVFAVITIWDESYSVLAVF